MSQNLLLHHFVEVDVIEPSHHYIEKARQELSGSSSSLSWPSQHKAAEFYEVGLEKWTPVTQRYGICKWLVGRFIPVGGAALSCLVIPSN